MNAERPYEMEEGQKKELLRNRTTGIQMRDIEAMHKSNEEVEREFLSCQDFKDLSADWERISQDMPWEAQLADINPCTTTCTRRVSISEGWYWRKNVKKKKTSNIAQYT